MEIAKRNRKNNWNSGPFFGSSTESSTENENRSTCSFAFRFSLKIVSRFLVAPLKYLCPLFVRSLANQQAVGNHERKERAARVRIGDAWLSRFSIVDLSNSCQVVAVPAGCVRDEAGRTWDARRPLSPSLRQLNYTGPGHGEKAEEGGEKEDSRVASLDICSAPFAKLEIYSSARKMAIALGKQRWRGTMVTRQSLSPFIFPAPSRSRPLFSSFWPLAFPLAYFLSHLFLFTWEFITEKELPGCIDIRKLWGMH